MKRLALFALAALFGIGVMALPASAAKSVKPPRAAITYSLNFVNEPYLAVPPQVFRGSSVQFVGTFPAAALPAANPLVPNPTELQLRCVTPDAYATFLQYEQIPFAVFTLNADGSYTSYDRSQITLGNATTWPVGQSGQCHAESGYFWYDAATSVRGWTTVASIDFFVIG